MKRTIAIGVLLLLVCPLLSAADTSSYVSGTGTVDGIGFTFTAQISATTRTATGRVTLTSPPDPSNGYPATGVTITAPITCARVSGSYATLTFKTLESPSSAFPKGTRFIVFLNDGTDCGSEGDEIAFNTRIPTATGTDPFPGDCPILTSLADIDTGDVSIHDGSVGATYTFPHVSKDYIVIGSGSSGEVFARTADYNTYVKSTDGMNTWSAMSIDTNTFKRYIPITSGGVTTCTDTYLPIRAIWPTKNGSLIANSGSALYRSTNGGTSWTEVKGMVTNTSSSCADENLVVLLPSCFTQADDSSNNAEKTMYVAPYNGSASAYPGKCATILKSVDDGVTWTDHSSVPTAIGRNGTDLTSCPPGGANVSADDLVRHLHGIAALPSGLWLLTGDDGMEAGIWKWVSSSWERKTPKDTYPTSQQWRAVSIQERGSRLYWGRDTSGNTAGAIVSAPLSTFAPTTINPTTHKSLNSSVFFSAHSGDTLYFGTSWEAGSEELTNDDPYVRVFAVDDTNAVHEVWKGRAAPNAGSGSFAVISNVLTVPGGEVYFGTENVTDIDDAWAPRSVQLVGPVP